MRGDPLEVVTIATVVEGHGEVAAVPVLLRRVAAAVSPAALVVIPRPHRIPRSALLREGTLEAAVQAAGNKVAGSAGGVIVLIDADDDCPAELAPALHARAASARTDVSVGLVLAKCEYEAWLLAGASTLAGSRGLPAGLTAPTDPEGVRNAKGWITEQMLGTRSYRETADQAALTHAFDLDAAREAAPSFDKFWREVEPLFRPPAPELSDDKPG